MVTKKKNRLSLRLSDRDMEFIDLMIAKYQKQTGKKPIISRAILYAVQKYVEMN